MPFYPSPHLLFALYCQPFNVQPKRISEIMKTAFSSTFQHKTDKFLAFSSKKPTNFRPNQIQREFNSNGGIATYESPLASSCPPKDSNFHKPLRTLSLIHDCCTRLLRHFFISWLVFKPSLGSDLSEDQGTSGVEVSRAKTEAEHQAIAAPAPPTPSNLFAWLLLPLRKS